MLLMKEILGDTFHVISQAAPVIAGTLINPAAGFATKFAMAMIANALNAKSNNPEDIVTAIKNSPNAHDILSELESKFSNVLLSLPSLKMPSNVEVNVKLNWN